MELSSPTTDAPTKSTRRKSGRVSHKPEKFGASAKRKRNATGEDGDPEDASDAESDEADDEEPDEEELKEQRRQARKAAAAKPKPPAKKKTKAVNGEALTLPMRPSKSATKSAPKRRKPTQAAAADAASAGGLYAEVFAGNHSLDDAAAWWLAKFNDNENEAMTDLFNFVLKCAGCDAKIETYTTEDTDSYQERLTELQDEFEAQGVYEYPLISRAKGMHTFRDNFTGIFSSIIETMAKTSLLFTNENFNEVLSNWLATMSSAASRPFRHTAVVASLTVMTSLCKVGDNLLEIAGQTSRQAAGEKKRGKGAQNKGRISDLDAKVQEAAAQKESIDDNIQAWFDTIFVHRYRDVDPRIRDECVRSLGQWILLLPHKFFEGQYLRYLGWILSDSQKETRHEVVKALKPLYQDKTKHAGLRTFTDRFRVRMVEMATSDSDKDVRADVIKLLDLLREAGFLEPSDIDAVGRCIFEVEPKIRKAVTPFLAETISELNTSKIDDLGGEEALIEALPNIAGEDEDFESPRLEWIKLKSLAEVLDGYDKENVDPEDQQVERVGPFSNFINTAGQAEPRICLVAESLYEGVPELHDWETLAGILLYDHSQTPPIDENGADEDLETHFKQSFKLTEQEEILLLEVLNAAVKMTLMQAVAEAADKKQKKTKAQKLEAQQAQEDIARQLAALIPRLFNKFGSAPEATSSVLRLYNILNLDVFKDLAKDVTEYDQLLDDVKKQFVTHANSKVLQEASQALLNARSNEELVEITDGKLQTLWEDTVAALNAIASGRDLSTRGNLTDEVLSSLSGTMLKISNLSQISDSSDYLDAMPTLPSKASKKAKEERQTAIKSVLDIMNRGNAVDEIDHDTNEVEDTLALQATQVAKFYLMWKVGTAKSFIEQNGYVPQDVMMQLAEFRDEVQDRLVTVLRSRKGADDIRVSFAQTYLDVQLIYSALGNLRASPKTMQAVRDRIEAGENIDAELHTAMAMEVSRRLQNTLLQIFIVLEKTYAKRARKTLEEDVDDEPIDVDDEPVDEDEDETREAERKILHTLLAERRLCEFTGHLSLGIWAGILDGKEHGVFDTDDEDEEDNADAEESAARRRSKRKSTERKIGMVEERLKRNVKHLGPNYKQVIDKLVNEHPAAVKKPRKAAEKKKAAPNAAAAAPTPKQPFKSAEIVIEDDEESEEDPIEDPDEDQPQQEVDDMDVDAEAGIVEEEVLGD